MLCSILAGTLVEATGCAHRQALSNDLLVTGYVVASDGGQVLDDLGLNVRFQGRLRVTRVLRGPLPGPFLNVQYIEHTSIASDREVRLHLRKASGGTWLVCQPAGGGRGYVCR